MLLLGKVFHSSRPLHVSLEQIQDGASVVNLASELAQKTRVKALYGGDLLHTTSIVQQLLTKMEDKLDRASEGYQRQQVVEELLNVSFSAQHSPLIFHSSEYV